MITRSSISILASSLGEDRLAAARPRVLTVIAPRHLRPVYLERASLYTVLVAQVGGARLMVSSRAERENERERKREGKRGKEWTKSARRRPKRCGCRSHDECLEANGTQRERRGKGHL